jgi:ferredoxin-NADP reductase
VTVRSVVAETPSARTLVFDVPDWPGHVAGQHVDIRLTADDGYQAQRSYSIGSVPGEPLALTIELFENGEVSPWFVHDAQPGDELEIRGPIGGHFIWRPAEGGPLLLLAGGSGLVPIMSMLRHHAVAGSAAPARVLVSARSWDDLLYRDELGVLGERAEVTARVTLTRAQPPGWTGLAGRVDASMLADLGPPPSERPKIFVCGPTAFVEHVADLLVLLGHEPSSIHAERFGPTGP